MSNVDQLKENPDVRNESHFWTQLFEQEQLALKLEKLESAMYPSAIYLPDYGHLKLSVARATTVGDGFLSDTFTINCTRLDTNHTYYAFIKVLSSNPYIRTSALTLGVFDREQGNYRQLHSLLRQLRAEAGLTNEDVPLNVPAVYYTCMEPGKTAAIVMEDLKVNGYSMTSKWEGCDIHQARSTLYSLANFHALGVALVRQHKTPEGDIALPDEIKFIQQKTVVDDSGPQMFAPTLPVYAEFFRRLGDTELATWFERESENVDVLIPEDASQCGVLTCVLHADCWSNNMMFRIDDEGNVQMRLIDWQITRLGHAVTDVLHFLFVSIAPELRADNLIELLKFYFSTLSDALRKLGIDLEREGYTDKEFHEDFRKRLRWVLMFTMMVLPAFLDRMFADQMVDYDSEDVKRLTSEDRKVEESFTELFDKYTECLSVDKFLANKVLSHRLIETARQIKSMLEQ